MRWKRLLSLAYALLACYGAASSSEDFLFQVSTLKALQEVVFDGTATIGSLLSTETSDWEPSTGWMGR
jgi:hypothetical protein